MTDIQVPNDEQTIADPVSFSAVDVTASRTALFENVDGHRLVSELSESIAAELELPTNVPYQVRDNRRAAMLRDDEAVGRQVPATGGELTLIPRSHLG